MVWLVLTGIYKKEDVGNCPFQMQVEAGDKLKIQTPSGGGYGNCE